MSKYNIINRIKYYIIIFSPHIIVIFDTYYYYCFESIFRVKINPVHQLHRRANLTYGCETWSTTKGYHQSLIIFERKVLRIIYGPLYNRETEQF